MQAMMERRCSFLQWILQVLAVVSTVLQSHSAEIYIGYATTFGGEKASYGTIPAVQLALEKIGESPLLPDHNLTIYGDIGDSMVH